MKGEHCSSHHRHRWREDLEKILGQTRKQDLAPRTMSAGDELGAGCKHGGADVSATS